MPKAKSRTFAATLEKGDVALGWTVARVPFYPADAFPIMVRKRVRGTINGFPFRTSLFPNPHHQGGYYVLVNRAMQQGSGTGLGDLAQFILQPDLTARPAELPDELDTMLDEADALRDFYNSLTEYARREIGKWILGVKSPEARRRRAEQMAERLLATAEAEAELPPAIAKALKATPKATTGWKALTPAQRRNELLAVFYYQSPDAREKRIAKLVETAVARTVSKRPRKASA